MSPFLHSGSVRCFVIAAKCGQLPYSIVPLQYCYWTFCQHTIFNSNSASPHEGRIFVQIENILRIHLNNNCCIANVFFFLKISFAFFALFAIIGVYWDQGEQVQQKRRQQGHLPAWLARHPPIVRAWARLYMHNEKFTVPDGASHLPIPVGRGSSHLLPRAGGATAAGGNRVHVANSISDLVTVHEAHCISQEATEFTSLTASHKRYQSSRGSLHLTRGIRVHVAHRISQEAIRIHSCYAFLRLITLSTRQCQPLTFLPTVYF